MEKMKEQLAELLEVDEVKDSDVLEDFECWDSLYYRLGFRRLREDTFGKGCK